MLRNFKGTEKEIIILAGKIRLYAEVSEHVYIKNDDRTKLWVYFDWIWSTPPGDLYTDIIGFVWSSDLFVNHATSRTFHRVSYYYYTEDKDEIKDIPMKIVDPTRSVETTFNLRGAKARWARSGWGQIDLQKRGKVQEVSMLIKYGHSSLNLDPSVELGNGVSLSFSPKRSVSEIADRYIYSDLDYYIPHSSK